MEFNRNIDIEFTVSSPDFIDITLDRQEVVLLTSSPQYQPSECTMNFG